MSGFARAPVICACLAALLACGSSTGSRGAGGGGTQQDAEASLRVAQAQALLALMVLDAASGLEAQRAANPPEREPDVVYIPTPEPVVDKMLEVAQIKEGDVVYDLGCGDGRIVIAAAKRYGVQAWGFDIDPVRVAEARANAKAAGVEDLVTIEQKDIFTLDLSPASVVTLYLLPELNVQLIPQLEKLKPGSRIVSHDFDMAGVEPLEHHVVRLPVSEKAHQVYLWKTPLVRTDP